MSVLEIKMIPNGPLEMKGNFKIIRPDGKKKEKSGTIHLCRCGHSNKKPYCDGSHVKQGFKVNSINSRPMNCLSRIFYI